MRKFTTDGKNSRTRLERSKTAQQRYDQSLGTSTKLDFFFERFSDSITANLERFRSLVKTFCQHFDILLFCQLISFSGEAKRAAEIQKKRNEILAQRHAAAEAFRIKNSMVRQNYTFMMVKFHFCTKNKILFFDGFDFLFSRFDRIFAWNLEVGTYHFIIYDPGRHWEQAIDEQDLLIFSRAHSVLQCEQSNTNYNFTNQIQIKIYKCKINHASTISINHFSILSGHFARSISNYLQQLIIWYFVTDNQNFNVFFISIFDVTFNFTKYIFNQILSEFLFAVWIKFYISMI